MTKKLNQEQTIKELKKLSDQFLKGLSTICRKTDVDGEQWASCLFGLMSAITISVFEPMASHPALCLMLKMLSNSIHDELHPDHSNEQKH